MSPIRRKYKFKAFIFDLDGVIVDTAKHHFLAWRKLANSLGFDFDEEKNEELKGVSRMESLDKILEWGRISLSKKEREEAAARKNEWYLENIKHMDQMDVLSGVIPFMNGCRSDGITLAVGSASKNAMTILEQVELVDRFEAIIYGKHVTRSKPDPQVFQLGAEALGIDPDLIIVFEDAASGVEAAMNGGFNVVGLGDPEVLGQAHVVLPDLVYRTPQDVMYDVRRAIRKK